MKPVFATLEQDLVIRQLGRLAEMDQVLLTIEINKILGEIGSKR